MYAVITAGSRPDSKDPLFEHTRGGYKALIEIAGKPMIQWVLDAINGSKAVTSAVVVGLPPFTNLSSQLPVTILPDYGSLLENNRAGIQEVLRQSTEEEYVLLVTSDAPTITAKMIDWVSQQIQEKGVDFLYPVIDRTTMEKRFPNSRRTYLRLKDLDVTGSDLMAVRTRLAGIDNPVWQRVVESRKNPIRQASILGFDTLFLILLRQLTLDQAGKAIGKRMGMEARAVLSPFAEMGMDVDKPNQLQLVENELQRYIAE